jgi:hypothetical protein
MKLTLQRTHDVGPRTFGKLFADGLFLCYTLEDEVREVAGQPVAEWKIHGETAIPSTTYVGHDYRITLENSPHFGIDTLTVNDVPGFVGVRMHPGNTIADTEGCVLLGMAITDEGIAGGTSRPAVSLVKRAVQQGIAAGQIVTMEVANVSELA